MNDKNDKNSRVYHSFLPGQEREIRNFDELGYGFNKKKNMIKGDKKAYKNSKPPPLRVLLDQRGNPLQG